MNCLEQKYKEVVTPSLMKRFNYKSVMEVPHADKIATNMDIGEATSSPRVLDETVAELARITGQAPVITRVKKSITNFKFCEGMPVGYRVTLKKEKMYDFMDRLMNISLPRVRDFRGVSATSFNGRGNYTLGIEKQLIFPEVDCDRINRVRGTNIVIVMIVSTSEEAEALLEEMGVPLRK